jgi:STE24 endopeptidase
LPPPSPWRRTSAAADYTLAKGRFGLLSTAFGTAVLLGWTLLGGLDALNACCATRAAGLGRHGLPAGAAGGLHAGRRAAGPAASSWYSTFRIEQRFGFNRMTPAVLADLAEGRAGGRADRPAAGGADPVDHGRLRRPVVAVGLGAWVAFNLLLLVLYPTVIAPLFNKFEPLPDEALKARVQALMQRCGFAAKGLFVMDGSKRSAHANAYFTGLGAAKRVVFFDTLLSAPEPGEVEAVLAHELGHFKHKHVLKRMLGIFGAQPGRLALLGWLAGRAASTPAWACAQPGRRPNDALALLLFMLALPPFSFFVTPLAAQLSRTHEFEADAYACAQASGATWPARC